MVSDAEDVTDKIAEYGTLDDEEIQRMKDSAVRKEQKIQQTTPDIFLQPYLFPALRTNDGFSYFSGFFTIRTFLPDCYRHSRIRFCLEVKHYNCFNELSNDETFICWDRYKKDVCINGKKLRYPHLSPVRP